MGTATAYGEVDANATLISGAKKLDSSCIAVRKKYLFLRHQESLGYIAIPNSDYTSIPEADTREACIAASFLNIDLDI